MDGDVGLDDGHGSVQITYAFVHCTELTFDAADTCTLTFHQDSRDRLDMDVGMFTVVKLIPRQTKTTPRSKHIATPPGSFARASAHLSISVVCSTLCKRRLCEKRRCGCSGTTTCLD